MALRLGTTLSRFGVFAGGKPKAGLPPVPPSYANPQGSGDRRTLMNIFTDVSIAIGPKERLINGDTTTPVMWFNAGAVSGLFIAFDFLKPVLVTEAKFYQSNTTTHGDWKWQGSNDASTWTDIGSSFTLGGAATQTITELSGNTTSYIYYRLLGVSGSTSSGPYVHQFEFKVDEYQGSPYAPSYTNGLGTGDRRLRITVTTDINVLDFPTLLLDGDVASGLQWANGVDPSGLYLKFDVGAPRIITEAKFYQSTTDTHGVWKWQGSNDNSTWTDIGANFTLGGSTPSQTITTLSANTTAYRYYRILGVSGAMTKGSCYNREFEFKID